MTKFLDLTGKRFGRLTGIRRTKTGNGGTYWEFRCDCGTAKEYFMSSVTTGHTKSCGCLRKELNTKHGGADSHTYKSWLAMRSRCLCKGTSSYDIYGGNGIEVCNEWANFDTFLEDMGERPNGYHIDRINSSKGYYKENCRWSTPTDNARNRTSTKLNSEAVKVIRYAIKHLGYSQSRLARIYNISQSLVSAIARDKIWMDVRI